MKSNTSTSTPVTVDGRPVPPDVESEVRARYAAGARQAEVGLCCPISYEDEFLKILPREIIEKDYGCGNPSRYVQAGETVLDLGSGAGKICYILAQKVGPAGRVIGVDFNDDMLALARKYQDEMAARLGYGNVRFVKARIQDLALSLDWAQERLQHRPIRGMEDASDFEAECENRRRTHPLVADESVDVVVSNCVLNLVRPSDKKRLFGEIFRVLKTGGRAVISDVVCDEDPTPAILSDPQLWSGCIAGAFREDIFPALFEEAGFYGIKILERQPEAWQVIDGIEFRSMTLQAYKGNPAPGREGRQAIVYKGPWKSVQDDDGRTYPRGQRMAVSHQTYGRITDSQGPYVQDVFGIEPRTPVPADQAKPFDGGRDHTARHPRESKGLEYRATSTGPSTCCGPDGCG